MTSTFVQPRTDCCVHGTEHFGFLCSTFGEPGMPELRADIFALSEKYKLPIWVSEHCDPELKPGNGLSDLDIIDGCMDAVRASKRLFLVTAGGFGTSLSHHERHLVSSYIEMELFQGAILERPIHSFVIGEIDARSQLGQLLAVLERSFPERFHASVPSRDKVVGEIERVLASQRWSAVGERTGVKKLVGALASDRHRDWENRSLGTEIQFLGGAFNEEARRPDKDRIELLLRESEQTIGMQRRIARVWLAIRDLMAAPFDKPQGREYLELWQRALGKWSSYAAWSGLHAHVFLGHLAALGSIHAIRQRLKESGLRSVAEGHTATTDGAFASCYYSLAKIAPGMQGRSFLDRSQLYVDRALAESPSAANAGLHAIRGSVHLRRWNFRGAIADYRSALEISEATGASEGAIGEYLAELGWAEIWNRQFKTGLDHIEKGVAMMQGFDPGFVVRGTKKLAFAYASNGKLALFLDAARKAQALAELHQLNGQMSLSLRLAAKAARRLRG